MRVYEKERVMADERLNNVYDVISLDFIFLSVFNLKFVFEILS